MEEEVEGVPSIDRTLSLRFVEVELRLLVFDFISLCDLTATNSSNRILPNRSASALAPASACHIIRHFEVLKQREISLFSLQVHVRND